MKFKKLFAGVAAAATLLAGMAFGTGAANAMGSCCCVQSASSSDAFLKSIICSPPYGSMIMTSWTLGLFLSGSSMPSGK